MKPKKERKENETTGPDELVMGCEAFLPPELHAGYMLGTSWSAWRIGLES